MKSLSQLARRGVSEILALRSDNASDGISAAQKMIGEAREYGLGLKDFLDLSVDARMAEKPELYRTPTGLMTGYEIALMELNLPTRDNFQHGIVLDAAADTFQTYPGTRALFPQVVDDVVQWKYRQEQLENSLALVSQSRTISGTEMLTTVVDDKPEDYQGTAPIAELARIPVRTIRTSEHAVRIYKHGGGIRFSYEFQRRVRLDLLTPFQVRQARELERSKVAVATLMLVNGDAVMPAAPVVTQGSLETTATAGTLNRKALLKWLVSRARLGTPIDTVVGNWDAYLEWLMMFSIPNGMQGGTDADILKAQGFQLGGVPILQGTVNFVLSSEMPAGRLLGYSKGDTLEELIEANSDINESERAIQNQSITYVKTQNSGYKLAFGDTRSILNYMA